MYVCTYTHIYLKIYRCYSPHTAPDHYHRCPDFSFAGHVQTSERAICRALPDKADFQRTMLQVAQELQAFKPETHETMSQAWIVLLQVGSARSWLRCAHNNIQYPAFLLYLILFVVSRCISLWHYGRLERALKTHSFGTRNWRRYAQGTEVLQADWWIWNRAGSVRWLWNP